MDQETYLKGWLKLTARRGAPRWKGSDLEEDPEQMSKIQPVSAELLRKYGPKNPETVRLASQQGYVSTARLAESSGLSEAELRAILVRYRESGL